MHDISSELHYHQINQATVYLTLFAIDPCINPFILSIHPCIIPVDENSSIIAKSLNYN
jgi:hypothetical protein